MQKRRVSEKRKSQEQIHSPSIKRQNHEIPAPASSNAISPVAHVSSQPISSSDAEYVPAGLWERVNRLTNANQKILMDFFTGRYGMLLFSKA